ncbi:MAG TPA: ArsA-related P-loop ATPase, partial [Actinomycetota bacterium]|nr:ArsA-related P-loop ATPase [Actinomycetota bacterium]
TDAVVVNRIIPDEVSDPYFGKWKEIQAEHLSMIVESFEPVPILKARLFDREMVGIDLLGDMAREVYGDTDPTSILHRDEPMRVRRRGSSYVLSLRLPFVERSDLDVFRKADELYISVGSYKRNMILPQTLQRLEVQEANFEDGRLDVRFAKSSAQGAPVDAGSQVRS